ncbi:MAG TPA: glycosyltransferase family 4 protein [Candidatus Paceibacterota bacterium]|nr:glycosyltransferase family 4 protein [Verrucomicrobiota bacterium]HSA09780.1 glycosyltransferase family 4 protein [Candidatus Paceibacterota bacterium]
MKIGFLTTDSREVLKSYRTPAPHFGTAPEALLQGFARLPEAEVHVVSCIRQPVAAPEKLAPNIFFHSLHVPKIGWMRTAYQGCVRAVRKKLRAIRPDIVHGQGTELDCALDAVLSGFPNVVTIHGNMRLIAQVNHARPFSFPWLAARLERLTIPRSAGVVCITRYTQQAVMDLARHTWVVPNAVDGSFFEVNAALDPGAPARLLCVAHVCLRKNQNAFIRALDPLARKHKFELRFCGEASDKNPYGREFFSLVRARPWCAYGGSASREELKALLRNTTVLVLPSLEDNCPMTVLEAMAAGVPVVAAEVGGLPDLIEPNKTGIFCNPLDPGSMATAVEKLLVNPTAAAEIARQARASARERFHPEVVAGRHLEIYREVLNRSGDASLHR